MSVLRLDYLAVGHVTRDLRSDSFSVGGTVSYAARTVYALGWRVGVVTSAAPAFALSPALDGVCVHRVPAGATTTFENLSVGGRRRQFVHAVAAPLTPDIVPPDWRASVVHIGPVARECHPTLVGAFDGAFVGVTPQGWLRRWDRTGCVSVGAWEAAGRVLSRADALVLSEEDVGCDPALIEAYAAQTRVLAVTRGAAGCTIYAEGHARDFPAPSMVAVDATGAGDVFAAAFFARLYEGQDPCVAAQFANCVAAHSVTREGLGGTPAPDEIDRCRRAMR
jgi:sugar/nucleoside kinase (ribokinase family)